MNRLCPRMILEEFEGVTQLPLAAGTARHPIAYATLVGETISRHATAAPIAL